MIIYNSKIKWKNYSSLKKKETFDYGPTSLSLKMSLVNEREFNQEILVTPFFNVGVSHNFPYL
jgi:hypothetical protein